MPLSGTVCTLFNLDSGNYPLCFEGTLPVCCSVEVRALCVREFRRMLNYDKWNGTMYDLKEMGGLSCF